MRTAAIYPRRIVFGAVAVAVVGAVAGSATTSPTADAAPPACTAGGLATTASAVLSKAGGYLESHLGANDVLTAAASQSPEDARSSVRGYFTGHPNEFFDLQNIAAPLSSLRNQCGVSLSPSQLAALMDTLSG
jgi:hemophore-related protein